MRLVFWVVLLSVVPLSVDARSEGWVITARDTTADYFAVAMANGEIGVAVGREPFALGSVILGGSYEPGLNWRIRKPVLILTRRLPSASTSPSTTVRVW